MSKIRQKLDENKIENIEVSGRAKYFYSIYKKMLRENKLFDAVEKVAKEKRLELVFDKSGDYAIIYSNPVHDYTDFVLEELGLGDKTDVIE